MRLWHGDSQRDLSGEAHVALATLRKWEAGAVPPPLHAVQAIAERYGVDRIDLLRALGYSVEVPPPSSWGRGDFTRVWPTILVLAAMTLDEVAEALAVTRSGVGFWETRGALPRPHHVGRLAAVLRERLDWHPTLRDLAAEHLREAMRPPESARERVAADPISIALWRLRKSRGLSREELAELSGVSRSTLASWERHGVPERSLARVRDVAIALQVTDEFGVGCRCSA